MNAAVKPSHVVELTDGSTLAIGRISGGYAVTSCCLEDATSKRVEALRGDVSPEQIPEHLRVEGPHPNNMYIPDERSPIRVLYVTDQDQSHEVFDGMSTTVRKV